MSAGSGPRIERALFDQFPYGLMLADDAGRILELNGRSAELLGVDRDTVRGTPTRCCDLVCGRAAGSIDRGCLTRRAVERAPRPTEVEIEIGSVAAPGSAWVTASSIGSGPARALFHLRPAARRDAVATRALDHAAAPELRIQALGPLRIETEAGALEGEWLRRRPGTLLKYMLCERSQTLPSEQIAEALWPNARQQEALTSVRHYVHQLRNALEPDRGRRSTSSYLITRRGGYALAYGWLDVDEFERHVERGLHALTLGGRDAEARTELVAARALYRGDFLADDPYAEWALVERDRLHELASRALRALIALEVGSGELELAADHARDLADLEPFDTDVHRDFLGICLRLGRRSEAVRRYAVLCDRLRRSFDEVPDFTLRDLAVEAGLRERARSLATI